MSRFLANCSGWSQSFNVFGGYGSRGVTLRPGGVTEVTEEEFSAPTLQKMIARRVLVDVTKRVEDRMKKRDLKAGAVSQPKAPEVESEPVGKSSRKRGSARADNEQPKEEQ